MDDLGVPLFQEISIYCDKIRCIFCDENNSSMDPAVPNLIFASSWILENPTFIYVFTDG